MEENTYITRYQTSFGDGLLCWRGGLLIWHRLPGTGDAESVSAAGKFGTATETLAARSLTASLEAYFRGEPVDFDPDDLPLDLAACSDFQLRIIRALAQVRPGQTITYATLAAAAGHPGAQRAVGSVMAKNPFPILIPCHRVIRSDGKLGRYSAGDGWKPRLLALEAGGSSAADVKSGALSQSHPIT